MVGIRQPPPGQRTIGSLFALEGVNRWPVYVSQDGSHAETAAVARRFNVTLWQRPRVPLLSPKQQGQAYLAQHYKWALDRVLLERNHSHAIVLEDDMARTPIPAHARPDATLLLPPTLLRPWPEPDSNRALTCSCARHTRARHARWRRAPCRADLLARLRATPNPNPNPGAGLLARLRTLLRADRVAAARGRDAVVRLDSP